VPVDFWNALAIVFVLGLPLALWVASDRSRRPLARAGAAVLLFGLIVGLLLTYSRGGILAGALALIVWLAFTRDRLESVAALVLAGLVAAGVFAFALRLPGVVDDGQPLATRVEDGRAFGLALVLGALAVLAVGYAGARLEVSRPVSDEARARLGRVLRLVAVALVAAGIVVLGVRGEAVGDWVERQADEFANPPTELVTQSSSRLTSISSNNRWTWWNEAWEAFEAAPILGTGAASFPTVHQILRQDTLTVTEPHSVPLQFLSETGVIGALLACSAGIAALVGCFAAVRRATAVERAPTLALAVGVLVYAAHSLVDFDWSFIASTAPVLAVTGMLLASGRSPARTSGGLAAGLLAVLLAAAVVISLAAPWLSARKVDDAYAALGESRPAAALDEADTARALDPLSLDPLFAKANAEALLGDLDGARASLIRAVELQPLDADAWYELGAFELQVAGRPNAALVYLERAEELDPFGPASSLTPEALAAASVNAG
jgi:O-antigen ligase